MRRPANERGGIDLGDGVDRFRFATIGVAAIASLVLAAGWAGSYRRGARARALPWPTTDEFQEPGRRWPRVTVIIPAWQERGTLEVTLRRLADVDYPDWETIVVAGGPDGTYEAARQRSLDVARCIVIEQMPGGKAVALNSALRLAAGEVVVVLDADTQVSPGWLCALVAPLGGAIRASTGSFTPLRITGVSMVEQMRRKSVYEVRREPILQGSGTIAVERSLLAELGGFMPDAAADDWDLDARLAQRGVGRAYAPAAIVRTERPATISEFWRNEVRWRRQHLLSLIQRREYFLRDTGSAARSVYPYVAGWTVAALAAGSAAAWLLRRPRIARTLGATSLVGTGVVLLREAGIALEVVGVTGQFAWLRHLPHLVGLFALSIAAGIVATVTPHRVEYAFKGPRQARPTG